ncbi:odorant receptor, family 60, subfamily A, member 1 [Antennarius striatus]|uniref:odorant receptor, family 60, subfamily A, member 1 n=1 Tax=Antennarius striatus TaxID=241820 RepID=UPI0035B15E78
MNGSDPTRPIVFTIYSALGLHNLGLAACFLVLYVSGVCVNLLLVVVVCVEPHLHRPMYVLLVNLALCGVMGSSSVCPNIIKHLVSSRQEASLQACLTQVFFTNVYGTSIFCLLALMAYDRYVSICKPLLYHAIMTPARLRGMLLALYFILSLFSALQVYLTSSLRLCRRAVDKLLCDSLVIANLACTRTTVVSAYGLSCAVGFIVFPCLLVILSYLHIFSVTLKSPRASQRRALKTCTPHLLTFINFTVATLFGVIYNRLNNNVPNPINVFLCLSFFVFPPLLHPIIYGIKMQEIQKSIIRIMKSRMMM